MTLLKKLRTLLQPRFLIALAIVGLGTTAITLLYQGAINSEHQHMKRATSLYAQKSDTWLMSKKAILAPLLNDSRLAGTAQDTLDTNSRTALYEFRYTQNLKDTYLFDARTSRLMRAPETPVLPLKVLKNFSPADKTEFKAELITLRGNPFFLMAQRLNYPDVREPIYAIAIQPLGVAVKPLIATQSKIKGFKLGLVYKGAAKSYMPHLHAKPPTIKTSPPALLHNTTTPRIAHLESPAGKEHVATQVLHSTSNWQVTIATSAPNIPYGVMMLLAAFTLCAATGALYYRQILNILKHLKFMFHKKRKKSNLRPIGQNNFGDFSLSGKKAHKHGRAGSSGAPIATPPKILAALRPTGHLKTWGDVQESIKEDRTLLLYQPIVDVATGKPLMYETFLRVIEKDGEHMQPGKFLPAMEHYHAAGKLDTHVLDKLLETHFNNGNTPNTAFTINLTGQAFDTVSFLTTIMEKLPEEALKHVGFELRHHEIRKDSAAKPFLEECLDMGLRLSVDYFGGGKAMLEGAQKMGFTWVKVTQQALNDEGISLQDLATAAKEVDIPLILERIENEAELQEAKDLGIPYVQGYHIGKPLPWEEVLK